MRRAIFAVLHAFHLLREGATPNGPLVQTADGALWGTTQIGGANIGGAIFRLRTDGVLEVMHSFDFLDGITPTAGLMLAADGSLWGTTSYNGLGNSGTVFRIDQAGNFAVVRNFGDQGGAGTHTARAPGAESRRQRVGHDLVHPRSTARPPAAAARSSGLRPTARSR
jgi:uncharacterized repeat protein (TIGR03803 family)